MWRALMRRSTTRRRNVLYCLSPSSSSPLVSHSRPRSSTADVRLSAIHERLIRILRSEIKYEIRSYNSDRQVPTRFSSFNVEDQPGGQWIRMRRTFGAKEDVKVDATMFDGFMSGSSGAISYMRNALSSFRLISSIKKDTDAFLFLNSGCH